MGRGWRVAVVVCVVSLSVLHGQSRFDGRWQGATVAGRRVALDLKEISGSRLTGTFTLDQQTVVIGGLVTSTLLTLLILPIFYRVASRLKGIVSH